MSNFSELILKHKGKVFCIMGGAGCLVEDLQKVNADVYISVNGHGLDLQKSDYVLAMDAVHSKNCMPMQDFLKGISENPIIAPHKYADYILTKFPNSGNEQLSGMVAAWAAFAMGAKCVVLAGMDAYDGAHRRVEEAKEMAKFIECPVRVVSGPLCEVWPKYEQSEKLGKYKTSPVIEQWQENPSSEKIYIVKKPTNILGKQVLAGEKIQLAEIQAKRMLKHKMIAEAQHGKPS